MSGIGKLRHDWHPVYLGLLFVLEALLHGCASTPPIQIDKEHAHLPLKILVVPSRVSIAPPLIGKVMAPDSKQKFTPTTPVVTQTINLIHEQAFTSMDTALASRPMLFVIHPPDSVKPVIEKMTQADFTATPTQDEADRLLSATDADAVLKFRITDYGLTPKSWRSGYVTFEVVTTLAITVAIASIGTQVAKAAAGTYLAQEAIEETAEGYAGFWALDVVCRPVRIEAELFQLQPVKRIWQTSDTGLSDVSLSRLTRHVGTTELNKQLAQSTQAAAKDVVSELSASLQQLQPAN